MEKTIFSKPKLSRAVTLDPKALAACQEQRRRNQQLSALTDVDDDGGVPLPNARPTNLAVAQPPARLVSQLPPDRKSGLGSLRSSISSSEARQIPKGSKVSKQVSEFKFT